jgi:biotin operon repressor
MGRQRTSIIELLEQDRAYLESLIRDGSTPQRVARRARILLALSDPETIVQELAEKLEQARNTIWHLCRRYEERGIEAVFDAPRSGRPWTFSPFGAGRYRTVGLL